MKLTKDIRETIARKTLENIPSLNYHALLIPVVQGVLRDHMPAEVRAVYDNEDTRDYLPTVTCTVRRGNGSGVGSMYIMTKATGPQPFYGLRRSSHHLDISVSPEVLDRLKEGTLAYDLSHAVIKSGYYDKHIEQENLLDSVKKRLINTLNSVTTLKRLYDVLEPELHHLIPKEGDKTANLPATAAPVVDDLRKLGAVLPEVPKAT